MPNISLPLILLFVLQEHSINYLLFAKIIFYMLPDTHTSDLFNYFPDKIIWHRIPFLFFSFSFFHLLFHSFLLSIFPSFLLWWLMPLLPQDIYVFKQNNIDSLKICGWVLFQKWTLSSSDCWIIWRTAFSSSPAFSLLHINLAWKDSSG